MQRDKERNGLVCNLVLQLREITLEERDRGERTASSGSKRSDRRLKARKESRDLSLDGGAMRENAANKLASDLSRMLCVLEYCKCGQSLELHAHHRIKDSIADTQSMNCASGPNGGQD